MVKIFHIFFKKIENMKYNKYAVKLLPREIYCNEFLENSIKLSIKI